MSGSRVWSQVLLSEICTVDWGNTELTKSAFVADGAFLGVSAAGCDGRMAHAEHKAGTPVLSAIGARCGTMFFPDEDFTAIKNTITLTPRSGVVDGKFLYYLFTYIELPKRGAAQPFISKGDIQAFSVGIPPLAEQKRIVAILDEAFEEIAKATANAERNLANARELSSSAFRSQTSRPDDTWVECTLGDQFTLQRGVDITKGEQRSGRVPVVSSGGIKSFHDTAIASAPGVVIGRKGSLGTAYFVEEDFWPHDTTLWVKDFKGNQPKFVFYALKSLDMKALDSGAANPALNRNNVHPIAVRWPPVEVQERIVSLIDGISDRALEIESLYEQKARACADLKQSLLRKAFAGELTGKESIAA